MVVRVCGWETGWCGDCFVGGLRAWRFVGGCFLRCLLVLLGRGRGGACWDFIVCFGGCSVRVVLCCVDREDEAVTWIVFVAFSQCVGCVAGDVCAVFVWLDIGTAI